MASMCRRSGGGLWKLVLLAISAVLSGELSVVTAATRPTRSGLSAFLSSPPPALLRHSSCNNRPGASIVRLCARRPPGDEDYYRVLGVERRATGEEIRAQYLQLAKKLHPDVSKDPSDNARYGLGGESFRHSGASPPSPPSPTVSPSPQRLVSRGRFLTSFPPQIPADQ